MNWKFWERPPEPHITPRPTSLTSADKVTRGLQAKALLDDPILREALQETSLAAHRLFELATTDEALRDARDLLRSAGNFRAYLHATMAQGNSEAARVEEAIERGKRLEHGQVLVGMRRRS